MRFRVKKGHKTWGFTDTMLLHVSDVFIIIIEHFLLKGKIGAGGGVFVPLMKSFV